MNLKFKIGTTEVIKDTPVDEGSVIFDKKGKIHLDADSKRVEISGGVGEATSEGGENFTTYDEKEYTNLPYSSTVGTINKNEIISEHATAFGSNNVSGCRAFKMTNCNETNKTYTFNIESLSGEEKNYLVNNARYYATWLFTNDTRGDNRAEMIDGVNTIVIDDSNAVATVTVSYFQGLETGENTRIDATESYIRFYDENYQPIMLGTDSIEGWSFTTGINNKALGMNSFATGKNNVADGANSFATGNGNKTGYVSLAAGRKNRVKQYGAVFGESNVVTGAYSFASGRENEASGKTTHAEGNRNRAIGMHSHVEGEYNKTEGQASHAEGIRTKSLGAGSHSEGADTKAEGNHAHAEGNATYAIGIASHAEGYGTIAQNDYSHAAGIYNNIQQGMYLNIFKTILKTDAGESLSYNNLGYPVCELGKASNNNNNTRHCLLSHSFNTDSCYYEITFTLEAKNIDESNVYSSCVLYSIPDYPQWSGNKTHYGQFPIKNGVHSYKIITPMMNHQYLSLRMPTTKTANATVTLLSCIIVEKYSGSNDSDYFDTNILYSIGNGEKLDGNNIVKNNAFTVYKTGYAEIQMVGDSPNSVVNKAYVGNIEEALDEIIKLQNSLIAGE